MIALGLLIFLLLGCFTSFPIKTAEAIGTADSFILYLFDDILKTQNQLPAAPDL
jgi:hypothetical protein